MDIGLDDIDLRDRWIALMTALLAVPVVFQELSRSTAACMMSHGPDPTLLTPLICNRYSTPSPQLLGVQLLLITGMVLGPYILSVLIVNTYRKVRKRYR